MSISGFSQDGGSLHSLPRVVNGSITDIPEEEETTGSTGIET
jgi:hypothetical protein